MTAEAVPRMRMWVAVCVDDDTLAADAEPPLDATLQTRIEHRIRLAWHLRQRDTRRALALCVDAEAWLSQLALARSADALDSPRARLALVRAEAAWLEADLANAESLCRGAEDGFARSADLAGQSDALALLAHVRFDFGDFDGARQHAQACQRLAEQACDTIRAQGAQALLANWALLGDVVAAERDQADLAERLCRSADLRTAMWAHEFFGHLHARRSRHVQSIAAFSVASELALRGGQIRRAVVGCSNVAAGYSNLGDHEAALEWVQRGLQLARPAGWPASIGLCLTMTGNSLFLLGRLEAAAVAMDEAQAVLGALPNSRARLVADHHRVDLLLAQREPERAARLAELTRTRASEAGLVDLACDCQRSLAQAYLQQGRRAEACDAAEEALRLAQEQGGSSRCIDALMILAEAAAPDADAGRLSLPHLLQAIDHGRSIHDYLMPSETLDAAARELAHLGRFDEAYALAREANLARDQQQSQIAVDRSLALQARHETHRLQAEARALREQSRAEARRALDLQQANAMLEQLGAIGQEIAAQRDIDGVFARVYSQLGSLLDLQHLGIWLLDPDRRQLSLRIGIEHGQALERTHVALDSADSQAALCARTSQEVLYENPADTPDRHHMPGTLHTRSALFGPLRVHDRLIGVMSIQSQRLGLYGTRERLVFRTVCEWAAVALDNASATDQLMTAQNELQIALQSEEQARRAAERAIQIKGDFLANISHDLRTPLASLHGYLETLLLRDGGLADPNRKRFLSTALAQSEKVSRLAHELMELARLESGSPQPAPQPFGLLDLVQDVVAKVEWAAARRSQMLTLELEQNLPMAWADPGMIERVLANLLDNAIHHAPQGSEVRVRAGRDLRGLWVEVLDTGAGIPKEMQAGLFAQPVAVAQAHRPGGGGLGLVIVQRLLQCHGREIELIPREGWGAVFRFSLPASAGPG